RAISGAGSSDPSAIVTAATPPLAPASVDAVASSATDIDVTWSDVNGESGYTLLISSDGGVTYLTLASLGPDVTSYTASGLSPATTTTASAPPMPPANPRRAMSWI